MDSTAAAMGSAALSSLEALALDARPLDASKLKKSLTKSPRQVPTEASASLSDESVCTDHMIIATWKEREGWSEPELKPYGPLSLLPTASCLHYATECFEGMKVYRGYDGKLRIFRPDRNAARFRLSASRISLPLFEPAEIEKLIIALISTDGAKWLPQDRAGSFLYIRPTLIGTQPQLGVRASKQATLFIIMAFMGRLDDVPGGMRLCTSPDGMVRAWSGGFGHAKVGSNYGPTVLAYNKALGEGFHQVLWLYGEQGQCTEAGGSNFFLVWKRKDGKRELITAPLTDQLVLDGVTRNSCLTLARERLGKELVVTERVFTIKEVIEAQNEGRLLESFSAGTAYFICGISFIRHREIGIEIPTGSSGEESGPVTSLMKRWLEDIMYGNTQHSWATIVPDSLG